MSREIETKICQFCESRYKLTYQHDEVNGSTKFCPFCGEENYDDSVYDEEDQE